MCIVRRSPTQIQLLTSVFAVAIVVFDDLRIWLGVEWLTPFGVDLEAGVNTVALDVVVFKL